MESEIKILTTDEMESLLFDCVIERAPCRFNPNEVVDRNGRTLLHWVASLGLREEVEYLLSYSHMNPNARDNEGKTPLHDAATLGDAAIVELLISYGADVHVRDKRGRTPLHYASKREVAELLIRHGADVNARDRDGRTPLHTAINVIETLLSYGADPNIRDERGLPPVYYVVDHKKCEAAMMLLRVTDRNIIINTRDENGDTLLHAAASSGCKEVTAELVKYIDVNAKNHDGNTPLHDALFSDATEIVKLLINHGANVYIQNNAGISPLQLILSRCRKDYPCAEILELIFDRTTVDIAILKYAFNTEQLKLLKLLYNRGSLLSVLSQI